MHHGLWPLSSHRGDAEQTRYFLCTQWICVTAEKTWIYETSVFNNGLEENLPNLRPKGDIFYYTKWKKTLPSAPDSERQTLPSDVSSKAIYYRNSLENIVTDVQKCERPMERMSPNNKYGNRHKSTNNVLLYFTICKYVQ